MLLDKILEEWDIDSIIDRNHLDLESIKIPKLISKYLRYYTHEKLKLEQLEIDFKELKQQKIEFFTQGATRETIEKGWILPAKGVVLNKEAPNYLDADKEIKEAILHIAYQKEKVEAIKTILTSVSNRSFQIKNSIEFIKFMAGK